VASAADADAAFFGGGSPKVEEASGKAGFDEFAGADMVSEKQRVAELANKPFDRAALENGMVLNVAIVLSDPSQLKQTQPLVAAKLEPLGLQVVDWQTAAGFVGQMLTLVRAALYVAIGIIFLVALVIINNSMVMATMDRVAEIGTMRAIGAQRGFVMAMFLIETCTLGLIAGGAGATTAGVGLSVLHSVGIPAPTSNLVFLFGGPRLYPAIGLVHLLIGLGVIVVVSLITTFYPALIATRIQPIVAMQAKE
jgi:ABC-type lipoprotein release transport system permease subunit